MILAVDIGNTNIVLGCCENKKIIFCERISTNRIATALEYASLFKTAFEMHGIDYKNICGAIISSVVPSVTSTVKTAVSKLLKTEVMVVGPGIKTGLSIVTDDPGKLGSDLVVTAVAGISEYSLPLVIIDMGTATTFSVIDKNKRYLGGAIAPGLAVSLDALVSKTSLLSGVALEAPKKAVGTNTSDCIKSGLIFGSAGMIDGLVDRINEEMGEKCTVVATGGLAASVTSLCKNKIIVDDDMLLKGLVAIYNKNKI